MTNDPGAARAVSPITLSDRVKSRLGVAPNFFGLSPADPAIAANLWGFAEFAYLDNPIPSLFKERLFVYLSRFCDVRYCIARHFGFLVGLGRPAGDAKCPPQKIEEVLPLLRWVLPHGDALQPYLATCRQLEGAHTFGPKPDTAEERAIFACAAHVFLQTPDAPIAHEALGAALDPQRLAYVNLLLAFVKTAHYWTKLHPELKFEDDIERLLSAHEALAACILGEPGAQGDSLRRKITAELESLQELKRQNSAISRAWETLDADREFVKRSLEELEPTLQELVSAAPTGVYTCDRDGFILYCNRRAIELWGREPELGGAPWSFLDSVTLYRSDGTRLSSREAPVHQVFSTGTPVVNRELVLGRPDQSQIYILANVAPLRDADGTVRGAVNIFQDITELKVREKEREELVRELERSNNELSQFSHAVSHDLQTPVRTVRMLTRVLVEKGGGPVVDAEHLADMIDRASDDMQRLVESLLGYAQVGQGELHRRTISVEAILNSVQADLTDAIAGANARIVCLRPAEVEADPVQIHQLFENLVGNAIKYREPGRSPVIEVDAETLEGGWRFRVTDNGQGIPPRFLEMVFEPLKRLNSGDTPGTGLGLAICRAIVLRHGGRIWAESKGAGCGSSFCFTLPKAGAKPGLSWGAMPPARESELGTQPTEKTG